MRSTEQINEITRNISKPYAVDNFITQDDVIHLIDLFNQNTANKIEKNTGPVTLYITEYLTDPVFIKILDKIKDEIGEYDLAGGIFFTASYPHIIHNDDTFELLNVYKGINIPLMLEGSYTNFPDLCFFDQFYFHGPAKFFKGEENVPTYYNKQIYDYADLDGVVSETFDNDIRLKYFTHLKPQWLEGLSFCNALTWKPTSAIIFDSTRLHCASDFRQQGITSKLGISIFTRYK
jgi:hypothetical protein